MTREEAKGSLIAIKNKYLANYGEDSIINILIDEYDIQAIDVAIQALEQEPSVSEKPNNCEMRDATLEERESIDKYIKSISKPTGVKFGALEQEPSDDCISRQAVLNTEYQVKIINDIEYVMLSEVQMKMRKLPSIKPQEKTGHWITKIKSDLRGDMWPTNPKCSECGGEPYYSNTIYNYKFCPYCGARMESEKNE